MELEIRNEPGRALDDFIQAELENKERWKGAILNVMMDNAPEDWEDAGASGEVAGIALADRLRRIAPELPIIFFTLYRNPEIRAAIERYPNSNYLDKREYSRVSDFVKAVEKAFNLPASGEVKQ